MIKSKCSYFVRKENYLINGLICILYKQEIRKSQYKRFYSVILHHLYHNALLRSCQRCSCQLRPVSSTSSQGPIPRWLLRKMVHIVYCSCTSVWFRNDWDIHIFLQVSYYRESSFTASLPYKSQPTQFRIISNYLELFRII